MLLYTIGEQSDTLVTLTESTTIVDAFYLFVFTNVSTKDEYKVVVDSADDTSLFPERINIFDFNTVTLFANAKAGQYAYEIYEQDNAVNTDVTNATLIECGKMKLLPAANLIKQGYEPTTTYKGYAG